MEQTVCSEMLVFKLQILVNHPEETIQQSNYVFKDCVMPSQMIWLTRLSIQFTAAGFQDSILHTGCVYILVFHSLGDQAAWYNCVLHCLWYVWIPYICEPGYLSQYSNSLQAGRSGDQIHVGVRFSAPVQTSPGAHPASCTKSTGPFLGVKQ
jgi:hypothetical protein